MIAMLCNVIEAGTGAAARLAGRDAAGKTGTTQEYRDAWFVGFTTGHIAGVWIGNDDNRPMRKVTGGMTAALIWKAVMQAAESDMPAKMLERSPGPLAGTAPEEVAVTGFSDDPMQGSTFVTPSAPPTAETVVSATAPIVSAPSPSSREEVSSALAAQSSLPQPPAEDRMVSRAPYQTYARAVPTPAADPPPAPTEVPDSGFNPSSAAEDAYYRRQRELDYWRMRREAMRPRADGNTAYGGSEYRRQPHSDGYLSYPPPRERADRPN
jgi:membrane peptidoglycan carboxypeptidase